MLETSSVSVPAKRAISAPTAAEWPKKPRLESPQELSGAAAATPTTAAHPIAEALNISRSTIYRYIDKKRGLVIGWYR